MGVVLSRVLLLVVAVRGQSCNQNPPPPLRDEYRAAVAAPYPADGLCSRVLGEPEKKKQEEGGTKFMVMMEHGRVGSSWLMVLLGSHPDVVDYRNEELASFRHGENESLERLRDFYDTPVPHGKSIGAKQKAQILLGARGTNETAKSSLVGRLASHYHKSFKVVCLGRSNPVEAWIALVNGNAHQKGCDSHVARKANEDCYTEDDARRTLEDNLFEEAGEKLSKTAECEIRSHVYDSQNFHEACQDLSRPSSSLPKTPAVFWLEYSDLFCRKDDTLDRLLAFLGLSPHRLTADSTKLTAKIFNMLPTETYRTLANLLATDTYVKEGALRQGLYTTDHCGYLRKYPEAPAAFCPNS